MAQVYYLAGEHHAHEVLQHLENMRAAIKTIMSLNSETQRHCICALSHAFHTFSEAYNKNPWSNSITQRIRLCRKLMYAISTSKDFDDINTLLDIAYLDIQIENIAKIYKGEARKNL